MSINIPQISVHYGEVKELFLSNYVVSACQAASTINAISGYLESCFTDIDNLTTLTSEMQQSIQTLSAQLDTVMSSAMFRNIHNVSMLKPLFNDHPLHLSVTIYDDWAMEQPWSIAFDSASPDCSAYIYGLFINGGRSGSQNVELVNDENDYSIATYWTQIPNGGFNTDFNNAPVAIKLYDWMMSNDTLKEKMNQFINGEIENLYIKCNWYYRDDNQEIHSSDSYSQIVPCNVQQTPHYIEPSNGTALLNNSYLRGSSMMNIVPDENEYVVYANTVNVLENGLDGNEFDKITLAGYNEMNEYKLKFEATGNFTIGGNSNSRVDIYDESGRVLFQDSSIEFESGNIYLVTIVAGMIFINGHQPA